MTGGGDGGVAACRMRAVLRAGLIAEDLPEQLPKVFRELGL